MAAFNFADEVRTLPLLQPMTLLLSTDDPKYGGRGGVRLASDDIAFPPLSAVLLAKSPA